MNGELSPSLEYMSETLSPLVHGPWYDIRGLASSMAINRVDILLGVIKVARSVRRKWFAERVYFIVSDRRIIDVKTAIQCVVIDSQAWHW